MAADPYFLDENDDDFGALPAFGRRKSSSKKKDDDDLDEFKSIVVKDD